MIVRVKYYDVCYMMCWSDDGTYVLKHVICYCILLMLIEKEKINSDLMLNCMSLLLAVIFISNLSVAVNMVHSFTLEQDVLTVHRKADADDVKSS